MTAYRWNHGLLEVVDWIDPVVREPVGRPDLAEYSWWGGPISEPVAYVLWFARLSRLDATLYTVCGTGVPGAARAAVEAAVYDQPAPLFYGAGGAPIEAGPPDANGWRRVDPHTAAMLRDWDWTRAITMPSGERAIIRKVEIKVEVDPFAARVRIEVMPQLPP